MTWTLKDAISGALALILFCGMVALLLVGRDVPTEYWALTLAVAAAFFGGIIPAGPALRNGKNGGG